MRHMHFRFEISSRFKKLGHIINEKTSTLTRRFLQPSKIYGFSSIVRQKNSNNLMDNQTNRLIQKRIRSYWKIVTSPHTSASPPGFDIGL